MRVMIDFIEIKSQKPSYRALPTCIVHSRTSLVDEQEFKHSNFVNWSDHLYIAIVLSGIDWDTDGWAQLL